MRSARAVVLSFLFLILAVNLNAELQTTYVSATGSDANSCDQAAPCRSVNRALADTAVGGTVIVADSAPVGHVAFGVYKGVTIAAAPGAQPLFRGTAQVYAPAGQSVTLRGLTFETNGTGYGILIGGAGSTNIESCVISRSRKGIVIQSAGPVRIADSRIHSSFRPSPPPCFGCPPQPADVNGIDIAGPATVIIENSHIWDHPSDGVRVWAAGRVHLRGTTVTGNGNGVAANGSHVGRVEMWISNCSIGKNRGVGIAAAGSYGGSAKITVAASTITGNQYGVVFDPKTGAIIDGGGNTLSGNATDGAFTRGVEP